MCRLLCRGARCVPGMFAAVIYHLCGLRRTVHHVFQDGTSHVCGSATHVSTRYIICLRKYTTYVRAKHHMSLDSTTHVSGQYIAYCSHTCFSKLSASPCPGHLGCLSASMMSLCCRFTKSSSLAKGRGRGVEGGKELGKRVVGGKELRERGQNVAKHGISLFYSSSCIASARGGGK